MGYTDSIVSIISADDKQLYGLHGICYSRKYLHLKWLVKGHSTELAMVILSFQKDNSKREILGSVELGKVAIVNGKYFGIINPLNKARYCKIDLAIDRTILGTITIKL